MKKSLFFALVGVCLAVSTLGHDMWLEPASFFVQAGDTVSVLNGNGTIFEKSENAVTPDRLGWRGALGPSGSAADLGEPHVSGHWLKLDLSTAAPGCYWVGLSTKPRKIALSGADFSEYLEHDGIPQALEERTKLGISGRDEVEQYSKHVKTYLQAGEAVSDNHALPLGLRIEIIPQENPYRLRSGDRLPVQVVFDGKPLAGLTLHAGSAGRSGPASSVETDDQGRAAIQLSEAGRWYLRGIHLVRVDQPDHSYESHWVSLTFEVRE